MPLALLAITPPTVHAAALAGSGPSRWPCGASARLARDRIVPGRTRRRRPPFSTVTPDQCRRTSTRMPSPCACPDRLVPAARNVMLSPWSRANEKSARTSSTPRASTTALGNSRYGLASVAYRTRSIGRDSTCVAPTSATSASRSSGGVPAASSSGARSRCGVGAVGASARASGSSSFATVPPRIVSAPGRPPAKPPRTRRDRSVQSRPPPRPPG